MKKPKAITPARPHEDRPPHVRSGTKRNGPAVLSHSVRWSGSNPIQSAGQLDLRVVFLHTHKYEVGSVACLGEWTLFCVHRCTQTVGRPVDLRVRKTNADSCAMLCFIKKAADQNQRCLVSWIGNDLFSLYIWSHN